MLSTLNNDIAWDAKRRNYIPNFKAGLGKNPGNSKKPMGMGKTGFYREKWKKREKLPFFKTHV